MSRRPDDALYDAIAAGGAVMGRSPRMPAFGATLGPTPNPRARAPPARPVPLRRPGVEPRPGQPAMTRRRWWIVLAALLAAAALLVARLAPRGHRGPGGLRSLVAPTPTAPPAAPAFADFTGAAACAECHETQFAAWQRSTHGRAGAAPPGDAVIAPFDGRPLRFRDAVVVPARTETGGYRFTVRQEHRTELVLDVVAVVGGGHMVGGGTQSFWARAADGTLRFVPFDWSHTGQLWFCNTNGRIDRGWVPITPSLALADCGDWPPRRVLGDHDRLDSCQQCHGSQIQVVRADAPGERLTRFTTLAIDCESCHGPGRAHVERARAGEPSRADIGLGSLAVLDKDASLAVCFRCHAVKETLAPGYLPGADFARHFSYGLPVLASRPHFPDGRIRLFAYQEQHRWSDCYLNGGMTCVSCHEPHGQGYWDVSRAPLADRFDDRQCTSCHPSKSEAPERHTFHRRDSRGSRCVACHMPYLQEPNTGTRVRYARSDHTIPIPRPLFDAALGIESACRQCHADRTVAQLDADTRRWWGDLKPHPAPVTGILTADSGTDRLTEARRLLDPTADHDAAQIAALSHFFLHRLTPDMPDLETEIVERLEKLAAAPDLDVRALALASLHLARGHDPAAWRWLEREARAASPALRDRWAWALTFRGDAFLGQREPPRALAAYRKAWEVNPGDAVTLRNLGAGFANTGDDTRATVLFRQSLARDSTPAATWVSLAFTLDRQGQADSADAAYRRAIALDPFDPTAYLSLGNAAARRGRALEAAQAWERALAIDPSLAQAEFGLASAYVALGRRDEARRAVLRGLQYEPNSAVGREMLARLAR